MTFAPCLLGTFPKRVTRKAGVMVTRAGQKDLSEKQNIKEKNNKRI